MGLLAAARERTSLGTREVQQYRGRQVCADTDLHVRALDCLRRHVERGSAVADIGCGQGAFSLRLADAGFAVTGVDIVPAEEQPTSGFAYREVNLFDPDARAGFLDEHAGSFDVVVLIEVIEHVHDPWETLRFARGLLRDGGVLFLSTPNLTSFYSRFRFLTSGVFHQFDVSDLEYGHINPMTALMVETVLGETGFDLVEKVSGPRMPVLVWQRTVAGVGQRLFHMVAWLVAAALTPLMRGGDLDGWSLFFVARAK